MNCRQFNQVQLEEILQLLGHQPTKQNEKEAWFMNPFGTEKDASFKLNKRQNIWYLFSEGIGGTATDFMQKYLNASIQEVLQWAERQKFSSFQQQPSVRIANEKNYKILEVRNEVSHPALIQYLKSRKLESQKSELKEIHYEQNGRNYFGLGFKNDSEGYEIRNAYSKICLGKKDTTTIENNSNTLRIFEGFTDYLSFKILKKPLEKLPSDYLILNSVSMINRATDLVKTYPNIELYLDNDRTGNDATEILNRRFPEAEDCRLLYRNFKDLNEFLMNDNLRKRDTGKEDDNLLKISTGKIGR